METIYEGSLVHYGGPRLLPPADGDTALLLGDYLYAHGLVRTRASGDVAAVRDLAELISLCACERRPCPVTVSPGRRRRRCSARIGSGTRRPRSASVATTGRSSLAHDAAGADVGRSALVAHGLRLVESRQCWRCFPVPGRCGRRGPAMIAGMLIVGLIFIAVIALGMLGDHLSDRRHRAP